MPVPGFDEYVALGYAATWLLEQSPEFRNLYRRTTMLGLDALGNMLYLRRRKVAFAPDTPLVRELVQHLNESHAFFGTHFGGIYDTEDAAVSALNVGRREDLWGIVAVRDDGDGTTRGCAGGAGGGPHCVSYAIRMRFTIVPDTFLPYDWFSRLSQTYLRYYTSGFLTLQHTVDNALLRMAGGVQPGVTTTYLNNSAASFQERYGSTRDGSGVLFERPPVPWGVPFPRLGIRVSQFYDALGPLLGLLMCMSMLYPLGLLIKGTGGGEGEQDAGAHVDHGSADVDAGHRARGDVRGDVHAHVTHRRRDAAPEGVPDDGCGCVDCVSTLVHGVGGTPRVPHRGVLLARPAGVNRRPVRALRDGHAPLRVLPDVREPGTRSQESGERFIANRVYLRGGPIGQ